MRHIFILVTTMLVLAGGLCLWTAYFSHPFRDTSLADEPKGADRGHRDLKHVTVLQVEKYVGILEPLNKVTVDIPFQNLSGQRVVGRVSRVSCGCLEPIPNHQLVGHTGFGRLECSLRPRTPGSVLQQQLTCEFCNENGLQLEQGIVQVGAVVSGIWTEPESIVLDEASQLLGLSVPVRIFASADRNLGAARFSVSHSALEVDACDVLVEVWHPLQTSGDTPDVYSRDLSLRVKDKRYAELSRRERLSCEVDGSKLDIWIKPVLVSPIVVEPSVGLYEFQSELDIVTLKFQLHQRIPDADVNWDSLHVSMRESVPDLQTHIVSQIEGTHELEMKYSPKSGTRLNELRIALNGDVVAKIPIVGRKSLRH
jgi:hypothetical protein